MKMNIVTSILLIMVFLFYYSCARKFTAGYSETGLTASDGQTDEYYGRSISLSQDGKTLAVGAYGKIIDRKKSQGKVYIYKSNGSSWVETGITNSDGAAGDWFGWSVGVDQDGKIFAAGAFNKKVNRNNAQGKVYIYRWRDSTWIESSIVNSDGEPDDLFGRSLAISRDGNTLAVGASGKNTNQGRVYVYHWNGSAWNERRITSSDGAAGDWFGWSVALDQDGDTVVVGASAKNKNTGKVYVYQWDGSKWKETGLAASDGKPEDWFGWSVDLSRDGTTLAAGAWNKIIKGKLSQGKVYIYRLKGTNWVESGIDASDGAAHDCFGRSISIRRNGDFLAVGAWGKNVMGNDNQGRVYLYKWNGSSWLESSITNSDGIVADCFGWSVSLDNEGTNLAVGAVGKTMEEKQGKVYLYHFK